MKAALLPFLSIVFAAGGAAQEGAAAKADVTLRGRLIDWRGEPIAGACLAVTAADGFDTRALLKEPPHRSSAEGLFAIAVARPPKGVKELKELVLHVAAPGRCSRAMPLLIAPQDGPQPPERDLGDVVLGEGARLLGRVRTAEGRPLGGARVVVTDLLERPPFEANQPFSAACATVTGPDGIFDLPCAIGQAAVVECSADGFFRRRLQPVSSGSPLEIDLQPSGFIAGRVLDAEGHGAEGALVAVSYELCADAPAPVRTGKDGSFRCSRAAPGRWRARAWLEQAPGQQGNAAATSAIGKEANETLELRFEAAAAGEDKPAFLRVRAVDKASGQPVPAFAAVSVFDEFANQNPCYLDQQVRERLRKPIQARDGEARVPGPRQGEPPTGAVIVVAKGYAQATKARVEWQPPGEGEAEAEVTVELLPESKLQGRVVDEATGAGIAGVRVWAVQQPAGMPDFDPGMPPDAGLTAADGSFTLRNLGAGPWQLHAECDGRPPLPPTDIQLGPAEQRAGVEVKLPVGARVTLEITGMPDAARGQLVLNPFGSVMPGQVVYRNLVAGGMVTFDDVPWSPGPGPAAPRARPDGKGAFVFPGVAPGQYTAVLDLPTEPRTGEQLQAQIEPFRVRRNDLERELDAADDRPGTVTGKVTFPRASVPFDRVLVGLRPCAAGPQQPFAVEVSGRHALLARDGSFRLRASPGRYRLHLLDLATGVELWSGERAFELKPGGEVAADAAPALARVRVQLAPAEAKHGSAVCRLEIRCVPPALRASNGWQGNEPWDSGHGLDLQPGQTEAFVFVPAGLCILLARGNAANLVVQGDSDALRQPLGRAEVEVAAEPADAEVRLELAPPPEIPEPPGK